MAEIGVQLSQIPEGEPLTTLQPSDLGWEDSISVDDPEELAQPPVDLPYINADDVELAPSPDELKAAQRGDGNGGVLCPVWFGTNRALKKDSDFTRGFSGRRDGEGRVHLGVARVFIPTKKTSWLWRILGSKKPKLRQVESTSQAAFELGIRESLQAISRRTNQREILLFVHGYNVSFQEAALRIARLGIDMDFPGIVSCFSWPSAGQVKRYAADAASVESAIPALMDFVQRLVDVSGGAAESISIIAHSMGNRAILRVAEKLCAIPKIKIGSMIMAAPDVDIDVFRVLAPFCRVLASHQVTLYASNKDRALSASRMIYSYPRAGLIPPTTMVPGIDTINVSPVDCTLLGHSHYGDVAEVLEDIKKTVVGGMNAKRRGLRRANDGAFAFSETVQ